MQCVGRFRPEAGIRVQVWDSSILRDQFLGQCTITANPDNPFGDDTTRLHYLCALLGRYLTITSSELKRLLSCTIEARSKMRRWVVL